MKSKMLLNSLVLGCLVFFSGCGGQEPFPGMTITDASIYHDKNQKSGLQTQTIPELNQQQTIEIGANLYQKINQIFHDTYTVTLEEDTEAKLFNGGFIRTRNLTKIDKTNQPLYLWNDKKAICFDAGYDDVLRRPIKICLIDTNDDSSFDVAAYSYKNITYPLSNSASYTTQLKNPSYNQDSFKYIALYQGKSGNKIKISFREFKDDMARPAFTQDIEYDLEKDGTSIIGFKGLRIEVLRATNIDITYKVLKDYK